MPTNYVNAGGSWRSLSKIFANVGGTWKAVTKGFANVAGTWRQFFGALEIETRVEISASPTSWGNSITGPTLTGRYYHWDDSVYPVDLSYEFQQSFFNSTIEEYWSTISSGIITTNPSTGLSATKTFALQYDNSGYLYSNPTRYYRFRVFASNSSGAENTSTSTIVTINYLLPVGELDTVTFQRYNDETYNYVITYNGNWINNTGITYTYLWQWSSDAITWNNISNSNYSSFVIPGIYKGLYVRPLVFGVNSSGTSIQAITSNAPEYVYYKTPVINSFTVTGGINKVTYSYNYSADDPNRIATIFYDNGIGSSNTITLSGTSASGIEIPNLPAGTYDFTLTVENSEDGYFLSEFADRTATVTSLSIPSAPTIGTVSRTNNTTVSIPFTPPSSNGGATITSYVATSNPSRTLAVTGTTSPLSVSGTFGLNTGYTFQIAAVNSVGTGPYSSSSNSVIVNTASVPGAPTIGTATASTTVPTRATVGWAAPSSNGGASITLYTATSSPGGITGTLNPLGNTSGSITIDGLSEGTAYTFTVTATNAAGTSAASAASNSITTYRTIPDITGYSQSTATNALQNLGFVVSIGTPVTNAGGATAANNGNVYSQTPFYGQSGVYIVPVGTTFTLRIYQYTALAIPSGGSIRYEVGGSNAVVGSTITIGTFGWSPTPDSYNLIIVRGTQFVNRFETTVATSVNSGPLSYTIQPADLGYYFKGFVAATNSAGTSSYISTGEIGPVVAAVADLTGLTANSTTSGSFSISWNASTGAGSYAVVIGGPNGISTSTTATSYSRSGLIPGSSYGIIVTPYSGTSGNGTAGNGQTINKQPNGQDAATPFFPPFFPPYFATPFFPFFPPFFPPYFATPFFPFFPPFFPPYFTPASCTDGYIILDGFICYVWYEPGTCNIIDALCV